MTAVATKQRIHRWRWPILLGWIAAWCLVVWGLRQAFDVVPVWLRVVQSAFFMLVFFALHDWLWGPRAGWDDQLDAAPLVLRLLARWSFFLVLFAVIFSMGGHFLARGQAALTVLLIVFLAATYLAQQALTGWAPSRYKNAAPQLRQADHEGQA